MEYCPFVSIIIPTYNRAHLLPITLDSFLAQSYPHDRYEIIIADNNSSDSTHEVAMQYVESPAVSVNYIFEQRQGVHYARNSAALQANGDIFYFTDDDMVADPDLLLSIIQVFSYDPLIGCATGKILPRFEVQPPKWVERHLINAYLSLTDRDRPEQFVISSSDAMVYSCHQAIRRDVFIKSGGYNPENTAGIWIGDGETGLNLKIMALGHRFAYTANSIIYHLIPKNRMTLGYLVSRLGNQGFCDSFTEYRSHRKKNEILPRLFMRSTVGTLKLMMMTLGVILLGRESWHFIPARVIYLHHRACYDLKLYFNPDFRKVAEIDDWLNCESSNITDNLK